MLEKSTISSHQWKVYIVKYVVLYNPQDNYHQRGVFIYYYYWPISDARKYSNIEKFRPYSSQLVATWLNAVQLCLELDSACVQITL